MKNVKISDSTHATIRQYCDENGLKISSFVDRLCQKWIGEHVEGSGGENKDGQDGHNLPSKDRRVPV